MKLLLPLIAVAGMILSASAQSSLRPQTTPPPAKPGSIFDKKTDTKAATIEFKVLLIIKKYSDTYSPLFLPIKSQMADADIAAARRCFEVETPDMVQDITQGMVRFVPTVIVSEKPLRLFDPKRLDSAEVVEQETLNEFMSVAKAGDYDSVGCLFMHYDSASGYRIPRAGYGVGGFNNAKGVGLFAIECPRAMNPRDEVFLHEFMHGLDGYYGKKAGVTLPKGALHGRKQRTDYVVKTYRPGDTFRGTMEWYRDYLQGVIQEDGKMVGLGPVAWKHGPMRQESKKLQVGYKPTDLPVGTYPKWVYDLMKGDLTHAELGPPLLEEHLPSGDISKSAWHLDMWNKNAAAQAKTESTDGGTLVLHNPAPNSAAIARTIPLEASTNYVFTAEVRTVGVEITEKGGSHSVTLSTGDSISTVDLSGTKPWTKIALPFTTSPKPESCVLKMSLGGFASLAKGEARFRNVQVKKIGYPATGGKTK